MRPTALLLAAEGFRVLAPDLPGFGRSECGPEPLGVPEMARGLARWLAEMGLARVDIVANSLGCQVACALAVFEPARVGRLVLLNPSADPTANASKIAKRLARDVVREKPALLWLHVRDDLRAGVRRIWKAAQSALHEDIYRWAPVVRHPAIVLRGTHDPVFPEAAGRRLAKRMPNAILVEMQGAPHAATYSAPGAVVAACLDFLRGRHAAFPPSLAAARGLAEA